MTWGFETEKRFPGKGTCLAIYSRVVNSGAPLADVLLKHYPWCAGWEAQLRQLFAGYVTAKQEQGVLDYDDLLLCWAQMVSDPVLGAISVVSGIMCWSMSIRTPTGCRRMSCWA
nr:hypothetical protein [Acetobacter persici]